MKPAGTRAREPWILLVEDDAPSRAFLAAALAGLPARVAAAPGAAEALALAASRTPFDLWLVDAHLPDADGAALLAALRLLAPGTPALAHTAAHDAAFEADLREAGFDGVLRKPMPLGALRASVRDALRAPARTSPAASVAEPALAGWFDLPARASPPGAGAAARRATLRAMFHAELPAQRASIESALAAGDVGAAAGVLHRLRASCGFAGAAALGAAVHALQADPLSPDALVRFGACVDAVLALAGGVVG